MFVENVVVCLIAGIVGPKAAILKPDLLGATTAILLDRDRREIIWRSRGSSCDLPYW